MENYVIIIPPEWGSEQATRLRNVIWGGEYEYEY